MDKKLTQEQIDALFGAIHEGGETAVEELLEKEQKGKFQEYDFNRPTKFKNENLKSLESIANNFARNFSQLLAARLRLPIQFQVNQTIEQIPYTEYIETMPKNQFVFCVVDMGNDELEKIIMQVDLNLIFAIHDKLMGGKNVGIGNGTKEMTDIESLTMEEWMHELMFPQLEEAFNNIVKLNLSMSSIETDVQYVKVTRATDMIALLVFDVFINGKQTSFNLGIPYKCIEPIIDRLTTENVHELRMGKEDENETALIEHHLKFIKRNVEIELGKTKITLKELLKFSKGDVLVLDKPIEEDLVGYVSDIPKFSCVMGREGNKVAVKITGFAEKEVIE